MPIRAEVKEAIEKLNVTPEYRKQLFETIEAAPDEFQGGWLRQSDYDRKYNEWKEKEVAPFEVQKKEWTNWYKNEAPKLQTEITRLQSEIGNRDQLVKDLQSKVESGDYSAIDENRMLEHINTIKGEVAALKDGLGKQQYLTTEKFDEELGRKAPGVLNNWAEGILDIVDLSYDHQRDFNERLDRNTLIKYANEHSIQNIREAYKQMTEERRVEKWREAERAKIEQEVRTNLKIPTDGSTNQFSAPKPPAWVSGQFPDGLPEGATTRDAAMLAAQKLREEQKY